MSQSTPTSPAPQERCASCGRVVEPADRWRWTTSTDRGGRPQLVCPDCAREHAHSFETGLDDV